MDSKTEGNLPYLVCVTAFNCNGSCNCPHFSIRIGPFLSRGEVPEVEPQCDHIKAAHRHCKRLIYQKVINEMYQRLLDYWIEQDGPDDEPGPTQDQNQHHH